MVYYIEFSLAFIFEMQAIAISMFIFIYFAQNPRIRLKRQHHSWLVLLSMNFLQLILDLPVAMSFYYRERVWPESNALCLAWVWWSFSADAIALYLMVWIAIERHLLVFHSQELLRGQWRKLLFHYIPIIICLIWPPIVYLGLVVFPAQCTNAWDFGTLLCGPPCYTYTGTYGIYDFISNVSVPLLLNVLINILLIIRVIKGKMSRQPGIDWRRHRKMILQFWAISTLHIALWSPLVTVSLIQMTVDPLFMIDQYTTLEYILYYMPLILPATCLFGMPEIVNKIKDFLLKRRTNVVTVGDIARTRQTRQTQQNVTVR
ncbi:unnamed protein product [Adineta steineri]|uniref:G-protein coupled receptors family 1 profile domain-containing protein n=1 Tax=Adineta steineri TaxID=433720 RepID=A0A819VXI6_9BILA|nr:unnamed protein product [Adineta steineri]CAF4114459.1 unnamed protein product [Adineta steineri]